MKILLVFPSVFEAAPVFKMFGARAKLGAHLDISPNFRAFVSGVRCAASAAALGRAVADFSPDAVVLAGFGGGCSAALKLGDVVFETTDVSLEKILSELGASSAKIRSVERTADDAQKRVFFAEGYGAVDMEGALFAEVAAKHSAAFANVRCISDARKSPVPPEVFDASMDTRTGAIKPLRMFAHKLLVKYPTLPLKFLFFALEIAPAGRKYAEFMRKFVDSLRALSK